MGLTTALWDRIPHRAHILFNGESYRFRESQRWRRQLEA